MNNLLPANCRLHKKLRWPQWTIAATFLVVLGAVWPSNAADLVHSSFANVLSSGINSLEPVLVFLPGPMGLLLGPILFLILLAGIGSFAPTMRELPRSLFVFFLGVGIGCVSCLLIPVGSYALFFMTAGTVLIFAESLWRRDYFKGSLLTVFAALCAFGYFWVLGFLELVEVVQHR